MNAIPSCNDARAGRVSVTRPSSWDTRNVYRRARELLDEIRRRSGEQQRPTEELDYLRRLLERF